MAGDLRKTGVKRIDRGTEAKVDDGREKLICVWFRADYVFASAYLDLSVFINVMLHPPCFISHPLSARLLLLSLSVFIFPPSSHMPMLPESRGSIASVIPSGGGGGGAQRGDEAGEGIDGRLRDKIRMRFIFKYVYKQGIRLDDRRSFQCTKPLQTGHR